MYYYGKYPIMHHFVTEMCTQVHISVTFIHIHFRLRGCLQCSKLNKKSCQSCCLESKIINIKLKKSFKKVPGPPPNLSASGWRTGSNLEHCCLCPILWGWQHQAMSNIGSPCICLVGQRQLGVVGYTDIGPVHCGICEMGLCLLENMPYMTSNSKTVDNLATEGARASADKVQVLS